MPINALFWAGWGLVVGAAYVLPGIISSRKTFQIIAPITFVLGVGALSAWAYYTSQP